MKTRVQEDRCSVPLSELVELTCSIQQYVLKLSFRTSTYFSIPEVRPRYKKQKCRNDLGRAACEVMVKALVVLFNVCQMLSLVHAARPPWNWQYREGEVLDCDCHRYPYLIVQINDTMAIFACRLRYCM